jgi:hypothetical protein
MTALKLQKARNPTMILEWANDLARFIVERSASVPHECSPRRRTEDFPEWTDSILQRHLFFADA